jgi:hypothetical protein
MYAIYIYMHSTLCPEHPSRRCIMNVTHATRQDGGIETTITKVLLSERGLTAGSANESPGRRRPESSSSIDRPYDFNSHVSPPIYLTTVVRDQHTGTGPVTDSTSVRPEHSTVDPVFAEGIQPVR